MSYTRCYTLPLDFVEQERYDEAQHLLERSHAIREKELGPEHKEFTDALHLRGSLCDRHLNKHTNTFDEKLSKHSSFCRLGIDSVSRN